MNYKKDMKQRGYGLTGGPSRNLPGGTEEHHDKPRARTKYIFCRNLGQYVSYNKTN